MEYIFILKGLDCANCANELERKINKSLNGGNCNINFMTKKLLLNCEESNLEKIFKICRDFEDGVELKRIK